MDTKEVLMMIGTAISLISAIVAVTAFVMNRKVAMGQAETALRGAIRATRQAVSALGIQIVTLRDGRRDDQLKAEDRRRLEPVELAFREAVEENLNAYEDACAKYVDGKIDRTRFHKMYQAEIRNLCECSPNNIIYGMMHPAETSKFQVIWKLYRKWHVHEK